MKKKTFLAVIVLLTALVLSSCTMLSLKGINNSLLNTDTTEQAPTNDSGDKVTISREEYERYKQFDDLLELMDTAEMFFYQEPDKQKMLEGAASGLLSGLEDVYSFYYTPQNWKKLWEDDEGKYAGVGLLISANYQTGLCTISRVFKGSPAETAGVQRGDILIKVNGELNVTAENLQDAVDIMRGTPGEPVDVTFLRGGEELTFTLIRAEIHVNQIESTLLPENIGYIALYEFAGQCHKEFEAALKELTEQGARGLIIDLRDNPGGWVDAARAIGDLFLDAGDLCYLVYRDGYEDHCYLTEDGKTDIPLVLLVNENSASASEILTGALRERANATVVGVKTYGKGVVQMVRGVGNQGAGFQMTIAQYLTPLGAEVHKVGITPDVEIPLEKGDNGAYDFADTENDPQLKKAIEVMLEKLQ